MKKLIASLAALGLIAGPALATTKPAPNAPAKPAKVHKVAKKTVKVKAAPTPKTSG